MELVKNPKLKPMPESLTFVMPGDQGNDEVILNNIQAIAYTKRIFRALDARETQTSKPHKEPVSFSCG